MSSYSDEELLAAAAFTAALQTYTALKDALCVPVPTDLLSIANAFERWAIHQ